jgi:hypothetical protein
MRSLNDFYKENLMIGSGYASIDQKSNKAATK